MKKHWAVVLPLLVLACGPKDENGDGIADGIRDPDSVSVVAPANPKGTVSGQVLDTSMQPLAGASVRLTIGSDTAESKYAVQTDGLGNFMIKNVPAGSTVLVTITKEGYATLRASATVPSSAGNIPINDGNASLGFVMLAKTQSEVRFTLLTDKGHPAVGAQAFLEAYPAGLISAAGTTVQATSTVTAAPVVADQNGVVKFANMPSPSELTRIGTPVTGTASTASYRLWVDPIDVNGDGTLDSGVYAGSINASALLTSGAKIITLGAARDSDTSAFSLVATNVPSLKLTSTSPADAKKPLRNLLRPGEPIYLGFSHPVARDSLVAILTSETGQSAIELTVESNDTRDAYTITPSVASVLQGQEYNLILRATSAYSGAAQTWKGYFVSGDVKTPLPLQIETVTFKDGTTGTAGVLDAGECVILTFNQVVTTGTFHPDATVLNGTDIKAKALPAPYPSTSPCFGTNTEMVKIPIDTASFQATSRFYFTYGTPNDTTLPPVIPNSPTAHVRVDFSKFQGQEFSAYYETAWGAPVPFKSVLEKPLSPPPPPR